MEALADGLQGMYVAGIPVGLLVDLKGPRPGVLLGGLLLGVGYLILHKGRGRGTELLLHR